MIFWGCLAVALIVHTYVGDWQPAQDSSGEFWKLLGYEYTPGSPLYGFQQPYQYTSTDWLGRTQELRTGYRSGHMDLALLFLGIILPGTIALVGGFVLLGGHSSGAARARPVEGAPPTKPGSQGPTG